MITLFSGENFLKSDLSMSLGNQSDRKQLSEAEHFKIPTAKRGGNQDWDARKTAALTASEETTGRITYETVSASRRTAENPITIGSSSKGLMSTKNPVGTRPTQLTAISKCLTAQLLVTERLAEGVKPHVTTKELQVVPSDSIMTKGVIVLYSSSEEGSMLRMETNVLPTSLVIVSLAEEGSEDTEEDEDCESQEMDT